MNYKLEKFWNKLGDKVTSDDLGMNYKLEKFWNVVSPKIVEASCSIMN